MGHQVADPRPFFLLYLYPKKKLPAPPNLVVAYKSPKVGLAIYKALQWALSYDTWCSLVRSFYDTLGTVMTSRLREPAALHLPFPPSLHDASIPPLPPPCESKISIWSILRSCYSSLSLPSHWLPWQVDARIQGILSCIIEPSWHQSGQWYWYRWSIIWEFLF